MPRVEMGYGGGGLAGGDHAESLLPGGGQWAVADGATGKGVPCVADLLHGGGNRPPSTTAQSPRSSRQIGSFPAHR